jgi:hypothetical protein
VEASTFNVIQSRDAVQDLSRYLDGQSVISIPLGLDTSVLEEFTFGGWMKIMSIGDHLNLDPRFIISTSKTVDEQTANITTNNNPYIVANCKLGVYIQDTSFHLCGENNSTSVSSDDDIQVQLDEWLFVALSFSRVAQSTTLFVNGQSVSTTSSDLSSVITLDSLLVGGALLMPAAQSMGFIGMVDNLFLYHAALTRNEIDFLRFAPKEIYTPIAGNMGSSVTLSNIFGLVVDSSAEGRSMDQGGLGALSTLSQMTVSTWVRVDYLQEGA